MFAVLFVLQVSLLWPYLQRVRAQVAFLTQKLSDIDKILSLEYFDIFVMFGLVLSLIFIFHLFCGSPEKERFAIRSLRGKPILTFTTFFPLLSVILVFTPSVIANAVFHFQDTPVHFVGEYLPPQKYIKDMIRLAFVVSLSLADITVEGGAVHWWLLPFVFFFRLFSRESPLLIWNAFSSFFPSRLWAAMRPFLAAMTLFLPLLFFPTYQPIHQKYMIFNWRAAQSKYAICTKPSFQACRAPSGKEIYFFCDLSIVRFAREGDRWRKTGGLDLDFPSDYAAYNFADNLAYLVDGARRQILTVNLSDMTLRARTDLDLAKFGRN